MRFVVAAALARFFDFSWSRPPCRSIWSQLFGCWFSRMLESTRPFHETVAPQIEKVNKGLSSMGKIVGSETPYEEVTPEMLAVAAEGVQTLKSWVTALELPRGLLYGMDKDGVPLELNGPVYIKYNSGGVYTFADIRKSGLGFDALWKPGDALLAPYDEGSYRGVYFQVELSDGEFRQYLMPLDLFQM